MKILLVNKGWASQPNIGLAYVATVLRATPGISSRLLDLTFSDRPADELLRVADELRPEVVGFSATSVNVDEHLALAGLLKARFPATHVILGGTHATVAPRGTLADPRVDSVCVGEGEEALPEFLASGLAPTPGIWTKRDGRVVETPCRPFITDLDRLPFPRWDDWDLARYQEGFLFPDSVSILSSRGCAYRCTYCSNEVIRRASPGRYVRLRSPENVVEEVLYHERSRPIRFVLLESENMVFRGGTYLARLEAAWRGAGLDRRMRWGCKVRADLVSEAWVRRARELGCIYVSMGLETGREELRFRYEKRIDDAAFRRACEILTAHGMAINLSVIVGTPFESPADIAASARMARRLGATTTVYSRYVPLPGTEMARVPVPARGRLARARIAGSLATHTVLENLDLLAVGVRRHGLGFLLDVLGDAGRLTRPQRRGLGFHPSRLLTSSPVKSAFYRRVLRSALGEP